jgi:hypothetical protein
VPEEGKFLKGLAVLDDIAYFGITTWAERSVRDSRDNDGELAAFDLVSNRLLWRRTVSESWTWQHPHRQFTARKPAVALHTMFMIDLELCSPMTCDSELSKPAPFSSRDQLDSADHQSTTSDEQLLLVDAAPCRSQLLVS